MKPLARPVMLGVAGLLLATLFAMAAMTDGGPPLVSQTLAGGSTNLALAPLSAAPIIYLGGSASSHPLMPGVYQTRPDAIILIVPKPEHDDRCVVGLNGASSKMPVVKPKLRAAPLPPSK